MFDIDYTLKGYFAYIKYVLNINITLKLAVSFSFLKM